MSSSSSEIPTLAAVPLCGAVFLYLIAYHWYCSSGLGLPRHRGLGRSLRVPPTWRPNFPSAEAGCHSLLSLPTDADGAVFQLKCFDRWYLTMSDCLGWSSLFASRLHVDEDNGSAEARARPQKFRPTLHEYTLRNHCMKSLPIGFASERLNRLGPAGAEC